MSKIRISTQLAADLMNFIGEAKLKDGIGVFMRLRQEMAESQAEDERTAAEAQYAPTSE